MALRVSRLLERDGFFYRARRGVALTGFAMDRKQARWHALPRQS
jgi:hypothetical protein